MAEIQLPEWAEAFELVCRRGQKALEWGLPEQWVHAELFSALRDASTQTGWVPFSTELPYLTYYPVSLPKSKHRDWRVEGAIKWVDLCLRSEAQNSWCWFELKVRRAGKGSRESIGANSALDAIAKDHVGLCGLNPGKTSSIWTDPDLFTRAYWFESVLGPHASNLPHSDHYFTSAYLHLDSDLDSTIFSETLVKERISSWFNWRSKESIREFALPEVRITLTEGLPGGHSLIVCQS